MDDEISPSDFHAALGAKGWRVIGDGACAFFRTSSFGESALFVEAISRALGVEGHTPDVDIRPDGVTVRLLTVADDYYGMTQRDADLAATISAAAKKMGLRAEP